MDRLSDTQLDDLEDTARRGYGVWPENAVQLIAELREHRRVERLLGAWGEAILRSRAALSKRKRGKR